MSTAVNPHRDLSVALFAASVYLTPNAAKIRPHLNAAGLDWDDVLYRADGHGITPMLYGLWRELDLLTLVPDEPRQRMEQAYSDNATRNRDARREFAEVMGLLTDLGIPTITLKGLPVIDLLYPDPAQRVLYDFDLLAPNNALAHRGFDALCKVGYTPVPGKNGAVVTKHLPSVWKLNGFVRHGYLFDIAQPRPVELHVTLWDSEWRGLDVRELPALWEHSRDVTVDGILVRVLSTEDTLIHLCLHLATHLIEREARIGQAIDIARLLATETFQPDWERLLASTQAGRVSRFVYLALCLVNSLSGAPLPPRHVMDGLCRDTPVRLAEWAERKSATDLLTMDYRKPDLHEAYTLTFAAARTSRERASVLKFALLPSRTALEQEYGEHSPLVYARHIGGRGRAYLQALAHRRAHLP